jgi:WXXGXW repeat (2 copies)
VRHLQAIRTAALVSACAAACSLVACNNNSATQNGAYVVGSTNAAAPVSGQPLPPSSEYQAVASTPPPALPVYDQPPIPGPGYVWTPGYWDWSNDANDYYWVPGTWVEPPETGLLWTPGYWRYYNGNYLFSDGYWGPQVGFYGGVNYGYGYSGNGYAGGRWQGNQFYYNSAANNLSGRSISATYSQDVPQGASQVSFNGGPGGLRIAPAQADFAAAQARHAPPTPEQRDQVRMASAQPQLRASVNRGAPPIAATARPSAFQAASGVTAARSAGNFAPPATPSRDVAQQQTVKPLVGRSDETQGQAPAAGKTAEMAAARPPTERSEALPKSAPPPMRAASSMHAQEMRTQSPPHAAPQHEAQIHAASPAPAAHRAAPKPADAPDRRGQP